VEAVCKETLGRSTSFLIPTNIGHASCVPSNRVEYQTINTFQENIIFKDDNKLDWPTWVHET